MFIQFERLDECLWIGAVFRYIYKSKKKMRAIVERDFLLKSTEENRQVNGRETNLQFRFLRSRGALVNIFIFVMRVAVLRARKEDDRLHLAQHVFDPM